MVNDWHSHVAQLTQSISQFALKPGEEEIKKKGWWRFWKWLSQETQTKCLSFSS